MEKFIQLIKDKKFRAAERILHMKLKENPEDVYLSTQLANVLWNLHKDKEALDIANKVKEKSSDNPLLTFTIARILWSLCLYEKSIEYWDLLLNADIEVLAINGFGKRWAKSVLNDSRYYKADCLYHLYKDSEALQLIVDHLDNRQKGIGSDFSKIEAIKFYKVLKYSDKRNKIPASNEDFVSERHSKIIEKKISTFKECGNLEQIVLYLKRICKRYPKEYYYKTILSEYLKDLGYREECLAYAKAALMEESSDPLVKYNYAEALRINGLLEDSLKQFEELLSFEIDYIAFSEHGEGIKWARKLLRDAQKRIKLIIQ